MRRVCVRLGKASLLLVRGPGPGPRVSLHQRSPSPDSTHRSLITPSAQLFLACLFGHKQGETKTQMLANGVSLIYKSQNKQKHK